MAFDGILIHHLVDELKKDLVSGRINKIIQPNPTDIILQIHNHHTYNFLISMSYNNPRFYRSIQSGTSPTPQRRAPRFERILPPDLPFDKQSRKKTPWEVPTIWKKIFVNASRKKPPIGIFFSL